MVAGLATPICTSFRFRLQVKGLKNLKKYDIRMK